MKLFTLAVQGNREINFAGDLSLQETRNIIDAILYQQAFDQGRQTEKQRIRQGYKAKRRKQDV